MVAQIVDRKNKWVFALLSRVNSLLVKRHFATVEVVGRENIPQHGSFLLVCNHISRWDGLLVYDLIGRPANFMVSPNELKGLQGVLLQSMGAFPASLKFDLQSHIRSLAAKGEALVVFPEGDIYRDGRTHPFKSGAARFALNCAKAGLNIPIVPVALSYDESGLKARVAVSEPISLDDYLATQNVEPAVATRSLTERLYREVCHLRLMLGSQMDKVSLFTGKALKSWADTNPTREQMIT